MQEHEHNTDRNNAINNTAILGTYMHKDRKCALAESHLDIQYITFVIMVIIIKRNSCSYLQPMRSNGWHHGCGIIFASTDNDPVHYFAAVS